MMIVQRPGQEIDHPLLFGYVAVVILLQWPLGLLLLLTAHTPMRRTRLSKAQQEADPNRSESAS